MNALTKYLLKLVLPRLITDQLLPALRNLAQKSETQVDDQLLKQLEPLLLQAMNEYIDKL